MNNEKRVSLLQSDVTDLNRATLYLETSPLVGRDTELRKLAAKVRSAVNELQSYVKERTEG